ncbi:MAG TPA: NAD(P)-dependent oxidoreductase [Nocardioidaceae bacterium]|nr:NAD(P)-dependent oxidoreductase [Nocardioidaceae bacterium]
MQVGFVGLGNLGLPMAQTLVRAGWSVSVYDTETSRVEECARAGATTVGSAREAAGGGLVALAVPDDEAVTGLLTGADGLLESMEPGSVVVVHSTVLPRTALAMSAAGRQHGIGVLDAPVSGGPARAAEGDLTVMVGGDPEPVERAGPLLRAVGSNVLHVGPSGAGAAVKLANQLMLFSALAGAHEALQLAAAYDVPEDEVLRVARTSLGDSWVVRNWGFFDEMAEAYDRVGTPVRERSWSKDLWDVVATARDTGLQLPVAGLLAQHVTGLVEDHARRDRG